MNNTKHPQRIEAENVYKKALEAFNRAERAYEAANVALIKARAELCAQESKYPTTEEIRRSDRKRYLTNIGLSD